MSDMLRLNYTRYARLHASTSFEQQHLHNSLLPGIENMLCLHVLFHIICCEIYTLSRLFDTNVNFGRLLLKSVIKSLNAYFDVWKSLY